MEKTLMDVKAGDKIAPIIRSIASGETRWSGVIHTITKVTPKSVWVGTTQIDKVTGRTKGYSRSHFVVATPEMIREHEEKNRERIEREEKYRAFHERPDYKDASAIQFLLSEMTPDNHPLDLLTGAEWSKLRKRLGA